MEVIHRKRRFTVNESGVDNQETEVALTGVNSTAGAILAIALAGGAYLSGYELGRHLDQLSAQEKVDIAASAATGSPVRRHLDFDALSARGRELAQPEQTEFEWAEIDGELILAAVEEHGGTALVVRDPDTGVIGSITASFAAAQLDQVIGSLQATGVTPKKLVGDLAQTSIVGTSGQEQVISLAEWTLSWKRKTVEATTTDDADYEDYLGSTKSWTAKAKYMFVDGDQSQVDAVLSAIDTTSGAPLVWNFFPTVESGRAAFSGTAIIDGIDIGSGSGKIVGLDVSLKGKGALLRKVQVTPIANANTATGLTGQV